MSPSKDRILARYLGNTTFLLANIHNYLHFYYFAIHAFYSNFFIAFLSFILPVEDCSSGICKLVIYFFNHFSKRSFLNFNNLSPWLLPFFFLIWVMTIHPFHSHFIIYFTRRRMQFWQSKARNLFSHFIQRSFLNLNSLSSWLRPFNVCNLSHGTKMVTSQRVSRKPHLEYSLKTVIWEFCVRSKTLTVHMRN